MRLSEIKNILNTSENVVFELENGTVVPEHFHVTEVGVISKHFIDCGGTVRNEKVVNFQLWNANDFNHRLKAEKLLKIINLSEKTLAIEDLEIEVEYQMQSTIGKFQLDFNGKNFVLSSKQTACLASDNCGTKAEKQKVNLSQLSSNSCCAPNSKCC